MVSMCPEAELDSNDPNIFLTDTVPCYITDYMAVVRISKICERMFDILKCQIPLFEKNAHVWNFSELTETLGFYGPFLNAVLNHLLIKQYPQGLTNHIINVGFSYARQNQVIVTKKVESAFNGIKALIILDDLQQYIAQTEVSQ